MRKYIIWLQLLLAVVLSHAQTFRVTISQDLRQAPLDGRLLLLLSTNNNSEPRFQISDDAGTQMVFGVDVDHWEPGSSWLVDNHAFGYPLERLDRVPEGDYYVQALLHKYETFRLKNGHAVK